MLFGSVGMAAAMIGNRDLYGGGGAGSAGMSGGGGGAGLSGTATEAQFKHQLAQETFARIQKKLADDYINAYLTPSIFEKFFKKPVESSLKTFRERLQDDTDEWLHDAKKLIGTEHEGIKGEVFVGVDMGRDEETVVFASSSGLTPKEETTLVGIAPFGEKIVNPEWPATIKVRKPKPIRRFVSNHFFV